MCVRRYLGFVLLVWFPGALHAQSATQPCRAPRLNGGYLVPEQDIYLHEKELTYACDNGRKPAVEGWWATSTCLNGTWSHEPQCIDEKACIPTDIPNGKYIVNTNGWYEERDRIRITCDKGYEPKDRDATAECVNGAWTSVPICEKSIHACSEPPKVPHAVIIDQEYQEVFPADTEVQYECEVGYTAEGANTKKSIYCIAGNWTEGPTCNRGTGPGAGQGGTAEVETAGPSAGSGTQPEVDDTRRTGHGGSTGGGRGGGHSASTGTGTQPEVDDSRGTGHGGSTGGGRGGGHSASTGTGTQPEVDDSRGTGHGGSTGGGRGGGHSASTGTGTQPEVDDSRGTGQGGSTGGGRGGGHSTSTGTGTPAGGGSGTRPDPGHSGGSTGSGTQPTGGGSSTSSGSNERIYFTTTNQCGAYPNVPNGDVVRVEPMFLKYQCNAYYTQIGPNTVRCQSDGSWSQLPICDAAFCVLRPPQRNLRLSGDVYIKEGEPQFIHCTWDYYFSRVQCINRQLSISQCCHSNDHQYGLCP